MGTGFLHTHKRRSGKPALRATGLLSLVLLCLPFASAAGRFRAEVHDGLATTGGGVQDVAQFAQVPTMIAQIAQEVPATSVRVIGVCQPIENKVESRLSAINVADPVASAYSYLQKVERRAISDSDFRAAKMYLLRGPVHGKLVLDEQTQTATYLSADHSYTGPDHAALLVEIGGHSVTLRYNFELMNYVPGSTDEGTTTDNKKICPKGPVWRISFNPVDPAERCRGRSCITTGAS